MSNVVIDQAFYGTGYRIVGQILNSTTLRPITGGLTALSGTISVGSSAAAAALTNAPVEIGTTGTFYVDVTNAEASADGNNIQVIATNASAAYFFRSVAIQPITAPTSQPNTLYGMTYLIERMITNYRITYNQTFYLYKDGYDATNTTPGSLTGVLCYCPVYNGDTLQGFGTLVFP